MTLSETLRALLRRWYIVVAGIILMCLASYGAWTHVSPEYERTSTQLLLPGKGTVPETAPNPYLFISGLTNAADVVARVLSSDSTVADITAQYPNTQIAAVRDPTTSGPVILITVTASSDQAAAGALQIMVGKTTSILNDLQTQQHIASKDRISVTTLTVDRRSALRQRKRLVSTGGAAAGILLVSLLVATLVDGLARIRAARHETSVLARHEVEPDPNPDPGQSPSAADVGAGVRQHEGSDGENGTSRVEEEESVETTPDSQAHFGMVLQPAVRSH